MKTANLKKVEQRTSSSQDIASEDRQSHFIPYGRQWIDEADIQAVLEVLHSDWLTTGPKVIEFERALADFVGTKEAVAVSNGTAALHAAVYAAGISEGDEVIVPPMTFVATANAVVFQSGIPVFADVDPDTLLIDPEKVEEKITHRTKAIIAVDYAGQPCDYDTLRAVADHHNLLLIADSCHSLGAVYNGRKVGTLADLTVFSFHPVKQMTTGEGGMVVTDNPEIAKRIRKFRNHGISTDHRQRSEQRTWYYEMDDLGYNYRITDIQSALGLSQLRKLPGFLERRRKIAGTYDKAFALIPQISPLSLRENVLHSYHLYVVRVDFKTTGIDRADLFHSLHEEGIGINVHYIPVHLHPYYKQRFRTTPGLCPVAEDAYARIISLPIFPGMTFESTRKVISTVIKATCKNSI